MLVAFSYSEASGSKLSIAVMPWGMVRVESTTIVRSAMPWACSAAIMMFLLLGSTNTVLAGTLCTAATISAVEGFIVCPPDTTASAPRSVKMALRPSPAATATKPNARSLSTAA